MHSIPWQQIFEKLDELALLEPIHDAHLSLTDVIIDVIDTLRVHSEQVERVYTTALESVHSFASEAYTWIMESEQSETLREFTRELIEQV